MAYPGAGGLLAGSSSPEDTVDGLMLARAVSFEFKHDLFYLKRVESYSKFLIIQYIGLMNLKWDIFLGEYFTFF